MSIVLSMLMLTSFGSPVSASASTTQAPTAVGQAVIGGSTDLTGAILAGGPTLTANIGARPGCGIISVIQFGLIGQPIDNARVTITSPAGGPVGQTSGFTYVPPPNTGTVTLAIQRVIPDGSATVSPILVDDACGQYRTLAGGGADAFATGDLSVTFGPPAGLLPSGGPSIGATLTGRPKCGPIERIQFGQPGQPIDNARVTITAPGGGPAGKTSAFEYVPPPGTTVVHLTLQRVKQHGDATIAPVIVYDDCGHAQTFIGAGASAFRVPDFGVQVSQPTGLQASGGPGITVTMSARATCGPIQRVRFGQAGKPFDNAKVTITAPGGGPAGQTTGFEYVAPAGTMTVAATIQRVVQSGGAMVNPAIIVDECGEWRTFFGGGPAVFPMGNAGVTVNPPSGLPVSGGPTIEASLSARPQCGPIHHVEFGVTGKPFDNARVAITSPGGGPAGQTTGFAYKPPAGTSTVKLSIQRVVQSGGATVSPVKIYDTCGTWNTFVGGGEQAFK